MSLKNLALNIFSDGNGGYKRGQDNSKTCWEIFELLYGRPIKKTYGDRTRHSSMINGLRGASKVLKKKGELLGSYKPDPKSDLVWLLAETGAEMDRIYERKNRHAKRVNKEMKEIGQVAKTRWIESEDKSEKIALLKIIENVFNV